MSSSGRRVIAGPQFPGYSSFVSIDENTGVFSVLQPLAGAFHTDAEVVLIIQVSALSPPLVLITQVVLIIQVSALSPPLVLITQVVLIIQVSALCPSLVLITQVDLMLQINAVCCWLVLSILSPRSS